jgi:hypothetical protein
MSKLPRGPDYVDTLGIIEGCANAELVPRKGLPSLIHEITVSVVGPGGRWNGNI